MKRETLVFVALCASAAVAGAQAPRAQTSKTPAPRPRAGLAVARGDTAAPPPVIMREVFAYAADGRRDPFFSLLETSELRPALSDLKLAGVLLDNSGRDRSVAILKDAQSTQYRVRVGSTLGRMRVAAIHRNAVVFLIEEFGASREDSLVLNDSTIARSK